MCVCVCVHAQYTNSCSWCVVSFVDPVGNVSWVLFPEGWISELGLRRGVGQATHTLNNPQEECTGVSLCVSREQLQLQLSCIGDISPVGSS